MPIVEVPHQFRCPILQELFEDPVKTIDGQIYERKAIEIWLESNDTSPLTNLPLSEKSLIPCDAIKVAVETFIKQANICTKEEFIKAIEQDNVAAIKQLNYFENYLELKFDYVEKPDSSKKEKNYTLFHLAVHKQNTELLKFLLSEAKHPHLIADDNEVGYTPLALAVLKGNTQILQLLLQAKADPNGKIQDIFRGISPLISAVLTSNVEIARQLLAAGANPNTVTGYHKLHTPSCLHLAAMRGDIACLQLLLEFKANVNVRAKNRETPLFMTIIHDQFQCFKALIEVGADPNLPNIDSVTPFCLAMNGYKVDYAKLLLAKKADMNTRFWGEDTYLHRAVYYYKDDDTKTELVELLLKAGFDSNATNKFGETPLHRAIKYNFINKIKLLLNYGANIYAMDKHGTMPIDMAKDEVADLLMNYKNLNSKKRKFSEVNSENEYELVKKTENKLKQQKFIDQYQIIHTQKQEIEKLKEEITRLRDELDSSSTHNTNVNTDLSKPSFFN